jgi:tRNA threonylcarbamoyl adenosine modification protein YjeE
MTNYTSQSEEHTIQIAQDFSKTLNGGEIIALYGDLGMGKSVFARAIIRALCDDPDLLVPSPTFSLLQTYESDIAEIWHFDLYRLEQPDDVYELGWEEALSGGIILLEWPERIGNLLPGRTKKVIFSEKTDNLREIKIEEHA